MHGIYKYVVNNEIIYIGKSDRSICKRINDHAKEDRFKKYLATSKIYYFLTRNSTTTAAYELALINKYQPVLNVKDKHDDTDDINFEEPEWKPYEELKTKIDKEKAFKKKEKKRIEHIKSCQNMLDIYKEELDHWYNELKLIDIFYDILDSNLLEKEIDISQFSNDYLKEFSLLNGFSWMPIRYVRGYDICSRNSWKNNYIYFHYNHIELNKYKFYINDYISDGSYRRMLFGYKLYVGLNKIEPIEKAMSEINQELNKYNNIA